MGRPPMSRAMIPSPPPRRRGKFWLYFLLISVTMIAVAFPTIIVVGIGMLPAMASWITDRTDQKCTAQPWPAGWFIR